MITIGDTPARIWSCWSRSGVRLRTKSGRSVYDILAERYTMGGFGFPAEEGGWQYSILQRLWVKSDCGLKLAVGRKPAALTNMVKRRTNLRQAK